MTSIHQDDLSLVLDKLWAPITFNAGTGDCISKSSLYSFRINLFQISCKIHSCLPQISFCRFRIAEVDTKQLPEINRKSENSRLSINETLLNNVSLDLELSLNLKHNSDKASFATSIFGDSLISIVGEKNVVAFGSKAFTERASLPDDIQIKHILNLDNFM